MIPFDFNNNGKLDAFDLMVMDEIFNKDKNNGSSDFEEEEFEELDEYESEEDEDEN